MNDLIDKFNPQSMAIEDSFYSQNVKSAILLGQLEAFYFQLHQRDTINGLCAKKVKQSVTGSGSATKKQVKYMVEKILNINKPITLILQMLLQ